MNKLNYHNDKKNVQKFDWGEMIWLHEPSNFLTERLSAGLIKFHPNKSQCSHVHFGEEQILYVISGKGIHVVNGEKENISEGMLLHCPPYSEHEVINTGLDDLIFLITYTPSKLKEIYNHIPIVSDEHISDILGIEILEEIQRQIGEFFNQSLVIMDTDNSYIMEQINMNKFCNLCKKANLCNEKNNKYDGALKELDKAFVCCNNIITIIIPILVNDKVFGYIKCGHFILNKSADIERNIVDNLSSDLVNAQDLIDAYNDIPLLPKSRLYVLEEELGVVCNFISHLIENNLLEKELTHKNNEILKTRKENIYLEDELKQVNTKLIKSKVSSNFENYGFKHKIISSRENLEYPFIFENKLKDSIKKFDEDLSISIIKEIINTYEKKACNIEDAKEVFEEIAVTLSRMIYEETKDGEMFLQMRKRYKDRIRYSDNYKYLLSVMIEFSKESISILRIILLNGKYGLVNKINAYIQNNFCHNITLSYIADMFFLSPNYLSTIFNDENAMSLKDYINKLRIEEAKKHLAQTNIMISDISKMIGYNQLSYFGSIFKKREGCTPNQYRAKNSKVR